MTLTTHVCVGAAIGFASKNPTLGFFAGLLSHHIVDGLPHNDGGSLGAKLENIFFPAHRRALFFVIADIVMAIAIFLFAFAKTDFSPVLFFAVFGAVLPDVIDNSPLWSPKLRKIFPFNWYHKLHETVHFTIESKKWFWVGILSQLSLVFISLYFIIAWPI